MPMKTGERSMLLTLMLQKERTLIHTKLFEIPEKQGKSDISNLSGFYLGCEYKNIFCQSNMLAPLYRYIFSEALILVSVNPQYDKRVFIKFPEKYKFTTCCVQTLFKTSKQTQKLVFFREFNEQSLVIFWVN